MERDYALERYLVGIAAQAAGYVRPGADGRLEPDDFGLRAFADARTMPGPWRVPRDWDREASEELADCLNYLTVGIQEVYGRMLAGDAEACGEYDRRMRAMTKLVGAWAELRTESS